VASPKFVVDKETVADHATDFRIRQFVCLFFFLEGIGAGAIVGVQNEAEGLRTPPLW
jgi:hypothetical protein